MTKSARIHRIFFLLLCVSSLLLSACSKQEAEERSGVPAEDITALKKAIEQAPEFTEKRYRVLDSLRTKALKSTDDNRRGHILLEMAELSRNFNTDSALFYSARCIDLAKATGDSMLMKEGELAHIAALGTAGIFTEGSRRYVEFSRGKVPAQLKKAYWLTGRTLYGYMRGYVGDQRELFELYSRRYREYDDSLLQHLPHSDMIRRFLECERLVTDGNYKVAEAKLQVLMDELPEESNLYGMAAYQMASVCRGKGNEHDYAAYLAKASASDIKASVREGVALPTLAMWLYEHGDVNDALTFVNFALDDAMKGNARTRTLSLAQIVPVIDSASREKISSSRDELMIYLVVALLLFILSVALAVLSIRSMKRRHRNEKKLAAMSKVMEKYIANFISLCATYADRLDSLTKTVSRKLTAGQSEELLKMVKSGKFADDQNEKFFSMFDNAFLDIYPDFIGEINTLLKPEEQIPVPEGKHLTPELRIYAFVRLGVDESTKIAQILHYSTNTVYAYRNRMRNRAIDRERFDQQVAQLGSSAVAPSFL